MYLCKFELSVSTSFYCENLCSMSSSALLQSHDFFDDLVKLTVYLYLHILQIQCTTKCYVCIGFGIYMFLMGDVFFMFTFILQIKDLFYLPCMYVEEFITILSAKAFIFPVFLLSQQQRKFFNGE